jgi:hypothetical protein
MITFTPIQVFKEKKWNDEAFIRRSHHEVAHRSHVAYKIVSKTAVLLFAIAVVAYYIDPDRFSFETITWEQGLALACFVVGILYVFFGGGSTKSDFIKKLKDRPKLLFEPTKNDIYIEIEDLATANVLKFTADDYGLMRITKDDLLIEAINHQVCVPRRNLNLSLELRGSQFGGVVIGYPQTDPEWKANIIAPIQNTNRMVGGMQSKRAIHLFTQFEPVILEEEPEPQK